MTEYACMARRIRKADSNDELKKLESTLCRLWDNGIFTASEFMRLDCLIVGSYHEKN